MEKKLDFETRFLLNIGRWLHEKNSISIEEIVEYENRVMDQSNKNDN